MSTIDLALDKNTHDLLFLKNDFLIVKDIDKVAQSLKQRLSFYQGEWFLDTTVGIPYFEEIFVKNPNIPDIESIYKVEIVETEDVNEILEFNSSFTNDIRTYDLTFSVNTVFGDLEFSESIFIGVG